MFLTHIFCLLISSSLTRMLTYSKLKYIIHYCSFIEGPSIKYITLFLANFDPLPPVTLCHTSRAPTKVRHTSRTPPGFVVFLVQKSRTKVPGTNSISIVCGGFCPGVLSGLFFVRSPFCHNTFCYNRKLNITFKFHVSYV